MNLSDYKKLIIALSFFGCSYSYGQITEENGIPTSVRIQNPSNSSNSYYNVDLSVNPSDGRAAGGLSIGLNGDFLQRYWLYHVHKDNNQFVGKFHINYGVNSVLTILSDQNVGIGTTDPGSKLHVAGDGAVIKLQDTEHEDTENEFHGWIGGYDKSGDEVWWLGEGSSGSKALGLHTSRPGYDLRLFNSGKGIIINNSGNVGIGTTNPYSALEVSPTATSWGEGIVVNPAPNNYGAIFFRQTTGTYNGSWFAGKLSTDNYAILRQGLTGMTGTSRAESTFEINHSNGNTRFGGKVGVGVSSPYAHSRLHIKAPTAQPWGIVAESSSNDRIIGFGHDGTTGVISTSYFSSGGHSPLQLRTSNTARMTIDISGNVGIGTADPKSKLAVNGEIRATRVKVLDDISVPDYVFEEDYELRTLQETKTYIEANKHLPEIPSAAEIGKDGIDLGDMNMRLLKKIEELTLYQIQLMEEMGAMKKELQALRDISSK